MKKTIIIILAIAIVIMGCVYLLFCLNENNKSDNSTDSDSSASDKSAGDNDANGKILVAYFSAQGHTKTVAKKIAKNLGADVFEIVPKEEYTTDDLNWSDESSRVSKEHDNEDLREVELKTAKVDNFDDYDTVLIGYPIWWGVAA